MKLSHNIPIKIYLLDKQYLSLIKASKDLLDDLNKLFNNASFTDDFFDANIVLKIDDSLEHIEQYKYVIQDDKIIISGKDDLGLIFGIYQFLEQQLLIPPFYKIEGLKLQRREDIVLENKAYTNYPKTRFRGWFINDEDLLTDFKYKGHRNIDYMFYRNVISPEMIDLIAETCLRFGYNLIIPSTLVDINSPFEDDLLKTCSERGLYLSQHHIEPLGVSKFGFRDFALKFNYENNFSFVSNQEAIEKCWEYYAKKWSKYPRVIWQLGLRGGTDKPVWATDKNVGSSKKERGALISNAMKKQYEIIKNNYHYPLYFSSTLWMEGADLLKNNLIDLPQDVIIVFSDIGMSQMFGEDIFEVKKDINRNYGIYYHAAYWHTGPHLAEAVIPEKMLYCYDFLKQNNVNYYSMLNVANVKELTFSIFINRSLLWDDKINLENIYNQYTKLYLKDNQKLIDNIKQYYLCLGDVGENEYYKFCHKYDFDYKKYNNLNFPVVSLNDGMIRAIVYQKMEQKQLRITKQIKDTLTYGNNHIDDVFTKMVEIKNELIPSYQKGFNSHWVFESYYWSNLFKFALDIYYGVESLNNNDKQSFKKYYSHSIQYLDNIINSRDEYFVDEYLHYQDKESKIDIKKMKNIILEEMEKYGN